MSLETKYGKLLSFVKYDDFSLFPSEGQEQVLYRDIFNANVYMWSSADATYMSLAGTGAAQSLQQVTNIGNITNQTITAAGFTITESSGGGLQALTATSTQISFARENGNKVVFSYPTATSNQTAVLNFAAVTGTKTITFQNASGTVAYLTDITDITGAQTLQQVATLGNSYTGNLLVAGLTVGRGGNPTLSTTLRSTAFGVSALAFNSSVDNTAIGNQALGTNSTGTWNTAIGSEALAMNTTANGNTAIGYQALKANSTGSDNTAIGQLALALNTIGSNNVAIGLFASKSNTSGGYNLSLGRSALENNQAGSNNVALGPNTLRTTQSGDFNIAIGSGVMSGQLSSGSNNIGVGQNALINATGSFNIGIGANVGLNITTGSNNILIGQVSVLTATSNNTLNIQNIIFGTGNSATGTTVSTGNIGIGINTPSKNLDIAGTLGITGAFYINNSSGTSGQVLTSNGTSAPTWQTINAGDATAWHKGGDTGTTPGTHFIGTTDAKSLVFKINNILSGALNFTTNSTSFGLNSLPLADGGSNNAFGQSTMISNTTGSGNSAFGNLALSASSIGNFNAAFGNGSLSSTTTGGSNTALGSTAGNLNTTGSNNIFIGAGANANSITASNQLSIQNIIYGVNNSGTGTTISTGNIGIGTKNPVYKLEVAGTLGVSGALTFNALAGTGTRIVLSDSTGTLTTSTLTPNSVPYINAGGSYVTSPFFTFDGTNLYAGDGSVGTYSGLVFNGRGKLQASVSGFNLRIGGNDFGPVDISKAFRMYNQTFLYFVMGSSSSTSHYAAYQAGVDMTFNGNVSFNNNGTILLNSSAGTAGQVLTSGGPGVAPTWTTVSGGGGGTITGGTNGLTTSSTNIKLGGTLTETTTIARSTFDLVFSAGANETRFGSDFMQLSNTSFVLSNLATNPVSGTQTINGSMYYNTAVNRARIYANGAYRNLLTDEDNNVITNRQPASYTLALTDKNKLVEMDVALPNELTIPNNSSVAFPIGSVVLGSQYGAGQTTIVPAAGVTLRSAGGFLLFALQYSLCTFLKIGVNEWYVFGDITG